MKILELSSILKEEGYIYYINRYTAIAKIEIMTNIISFPLSFTIEMNPFGVKTIDLDPLPKEIDYPVIPLSKSLKEFISLMDKEGSLPQT